MNDISVMNIMRSIVPISRFNKGEANRIFEEVEKSGTKIVMKNNKPACVLMSPDKYEMIMETLSDYALLEEAKERMSRYSPNEALTHQEVLDALGISEEALSEKETERRIKKL